MMFRTMLVLLFIVVASRCTGQVATNAEFEGIAKRGIELVYDLEFERAEREFSTLVRLQPAHPAGHFLLAMVDWWRILIDLEEERYDERFLGALDRVIEMCDSLLDHNENDVTAIFFKGGSIGFQGRLLFHRNDYLSAANAGRKALPLVQTALDLAPENHDLLLGAGMYNYYADVIPREYPFLKPLLLFIPPGDKKRGLQQLTLASEKATYAAVEATYFLMQVYYFYEKDYPKACTIALGLHGRFPNNMLFHRYLGRCYASLGNWEMAAQTFAQISARVRGGQRGYGVAADREAAYYLGLTHMTKRRYDDALPYFYRCDELSRNLDRKEPSGFMVMTNLKIGMIYDLQSKRDLAVRQYQKILDMRTYNDSHALAERYIKTPYVE